MNKKIILILIFVLIEILISINIIYNKFCFKPFTKLTYEEIQETCFSKKNVTCNIPINLATIDKTKLKKDYKFEIHVKYTSKAQKALEIIVLAFLIGIFIYTFKNTRKKEDEEYSFKDLFLFSLLANYKSIYITSINITQISLWVSFLTISFGIILFFILYFLAKAFSKNKTDSILISIFLCSVAFSSRNIFPLEYYRFSVHTSPDALIAIGIFVTVLSLIFLLNSKKILEFIKRTTLILLLLCLLNACSQIAKESIPRFEKINLKTNLEIKKTDFNKNVYILLLDSYSGKTTLENLNHDNSDFYNELKKENFKVFENFQSNYNRTILALSSIFNLDFVENIPQKTANNAISEGEFFKLFKKLNYKIFYYNEDSLITPREDSFDLISTNNEFTTYHSLNTLTQGTIFEPILDLSFINKKKEPPFIDLVFREKNKKLVFMHFMMPHPPYRFDENGNPYNTPCELQLDYKTMLYGLNKEAYIKFLKYANKETLKLIKQIKEQDENSIIILMGDHGARLKCYYDGEWRHLEEFKKEKEALFTSFNTFLAYYDNSNQKENYKEAKSLINFYRMFVNEKFGTKLEKLPDRKFFLYTDEDDIKIQNIKGFEVS